MKSLVKVSAVLSGAAMMMYGVADVAHAGENIPWTWNSDDFDAKGKFVAYGEIVKGYELRGNTYIDWWTNTQGSSRWYIPCCDTVEDLNLDLPEGDAMGINVSQLHTAWPDDCSDWKYGIT